MSHRDAVQQSPVGAGFKSAREFYPGSIIDGARNPPGFVLLTKNMKSGTSTINPHEPPPLAATRGRAGRGLYLRFVSILMGLAFFLSIPTSAAYQATPALLTVGSVIPRFDESPFTSEQWLAEISQLDTATGQHTVLVPLWGANAPLYAAQISALSWSPHSDLLAMTLIDSQGRVGLVLFDAGNESYRPVISFEDGYTQISRASWQPDATEIVFSASTESEIPQILGFNLLLSSTTVLNAGRMPVFSPSGAAMIYLNAADEAVIMADGTERTYVLPYEKVTSWLWLPDETGLLINTGTQIFTFDLTSQRSTLIFEGALVEYTEVSLPGMAMSPDGTQIALTRVGSSPDATGISQVITVDLATQRMTIQAERVFTTTLPDDPRLFLQVDYQPPGAALPGASAEGDF